MLLENNPYPADVRVRREAESLALAGHRVRVIAPRAPGQSRTEVVDGVEVRRFRLPAGRGGAPGFVLEYLVGSLALNAAALRELAGGAGVLHLHNPPDTLFPAAFAARLLGRGVVFDHHDLFPELVEARYGPGPLVRLARAAERATFRSAGAVIAANESGAEVARGRGHVPAGSVTVVRNGPPREWLSLAGGGRPGVLEDPRLAYLGAVAPQDGVAGLAPVLASLTDQHGLSGARLTVIGDGDARAALEASLADAGVSELVEITGWLAPERVPGLLADADVCLDPAPANGINERSTMIKIAEYMALGKPVVAYDLLETRRTLGDTGVLVPAGDAAAFAAAVAELARDPERRRELGARARERARGLTWEHSERSLLAAYDRL
jgi:glycosyltransferase involved in cell wall biosynthesis